MYSPLHKIIGQGEGKPLAPTVIFRALSSLSIFSIIKIEQSLMK